MRPVAGKSRSFGDCEYALVGRNGRDEGRAISHQKEVQRIETGEEEGDYGSRDILISCISATQAISQREGELR